MPYGPNPNRPFIDPLAGGGFDHLPWYDATFANLADAQNNVNRLFGAGPYYADAPVANLTRGFFSFDAQTLVVGVHNDLEGAHVSILGGFGWGFTIGADKKTVTLNGIVPLYDTDPLRQAFQTALNLDFSGYLMTPTFQECPEDPALTLAPVPSSITLLAVGLLSIFPAYRRWRAASMTQIAV
jgi:hypothetical protein